MELATVEDMSSTGRKFGGVTSGTWEARWSHTPTKAMRVPALMVDALATIAREADKQPDPIAYLESLRPGGAPPAPTAPPPPVDGDIAAMNVAQLRKLAAARGMAGAARANKSALLEFLG